MTKRRGILIAIEGCDRGGKTTQCRLLQTWLKSHAGQDGECIKFPDRTTPIGKIINEYLAGGTTLSDPAIHLLFSANRWELKETMEAKLASGLSLVLDRYAPSGVAYSSAKGLPLDWCKAPDSGLPKPDLVVFIDVPAEGSATRGGFGEERYEKPDFQTKVRGCFDALMDETWIIVDGQGSVEEVATRLQTAVKGRISQFLAMPEQPLKHLQWH